MITRTPGRRPDFSAGLITAVVRDAADGAVLMVAHMNEAAFEATRTTSRATFYSRSRQRLWEKGETSGHTMRVLEIAIDCDGDAVLLTVEPHGPACHTGARSCFEQPPDQGDATEPGSPQRSRTDDAPGSGAATDA